MAADRSRGPARGCYVTATRTAANLRVRLVEHTPRVHLGSVLVTLQRQQAATWAHWEASGQPVLFRPVAQTFSQAGVPFLTVTVALVLDGRHGRARLCWSTARATGDTLVQLVAIPCRVIGLRWHWVCPQTGRRTLRLYLPPGAPPACRQAHGIRYRSEFRRPEERAAIQARKLRARLGEVPAVLGTRLPDPPPRMRVRTFQQLAQAIREAEARALV